MHIFLGASHSTSMIRLIGTFFFILCLTACSSGKKEQGGSPDSSMSGGDAGISGALLLLDPKNATRRTTLRLTSSGFDLSSAKILWTVNEREFTPVVPGQFDGNDAGKGDVIQAKALVGNREVLSNPVTIANAPPEITRLKLLPEVFRPGDTLNIEVEGNDADGDKITFLYAWTRNGEAVGQGKALGSDVVLKRGDKISVRIIPFDGEVNGKSGVISSEIANFPPIITDHKEFAFDGKVYTYQVRASDPDGDSLTYEASSLENGMTLDAASGLLRWNVPPEFKGSRDVSITVNDGQGGTASYSVTITIQ